MQNQNIGGIEKHYQLDRIFTLEEDSRERNESNHAVSFGRDLKKVVRSEGDERVEFRESGGLIGGALREREVQRSESLVELAGGQGGAARLVGFVGHVRVVSLVGLQESGGT